MYYSLDRVAIALALWAGLIVLFISTAVSALGNEQSTTHQYRLDSSPVNSGDGWQTIRPSQAGFDPKGLARLTWEIETGTIHNVHAVIIARHGKLLYERYFSGVDQRWGYPLGKVEFNTDSLHDLRSITKSVATAVLGIALAGRHDEALARPISSFFPHLQPKIKKATSGITLEHVVTMTTGLEWNEMEVPRSNPVNDETRLDEAADPIEFVLARPARHPPGSKWYYSAGLAQVVAGVVRHETGLPIHTFAQRALFEPLGISVFEWLGSATWDEQQGPSAASGLRMRARDLAKIGSVYLHDGKWQGKQVIPADWIKRSVSPHVQQIKWGRSTGIYGYGFMWYPGVTNDTDKHRLFRAAGNGNQRIFVLPDLALNIVVFAGNYNDYSHRSDAKVLRHVLRSLAGRE